MITRRKAARASTPMPIRKPSMIIISPIASSASPSQARIGSNLSCSGEIAKGPTFQAKTVARPITAFPAKSPAISK